MQTHYYDVRVATTDRGGAGTDADVSITIYGDRGEFKQTLTDLPGDDFESGDVDNYLMSTNEPVGKIHAMKLEHDDSGGGSGWHVNYVHIVDRDNNSNSKRFKVDRWLATDEADGKVEVTLGRKPAVVITSNPEDYKPVFVRIEDVNLVTHTSPYTYTLSIEESESIELTRATENSDTTETGVDVTVSTEGSIGPISSSLEVSTHYAEEIFKSVSTSASKAKQHTESREKKREFTAPEDKVIAVVEERYRMKAEGGELKLGSETIKFSASGDTYTKARILDSFDLPQDQDRLDALKEEYSEYGL